jgi:hypothetical protein
MGETVEASKRCRGFSIVAEDRRLGVGSGAVGVHVTFDKSILIATCGNEDFVIRVGSEADVLLGFCPRMREHGVSAAA